MSQISYEMFETQKKETEEIQRPATNIGYFSLKNDGDEAIIRFMHESPDDFDIVTAHPMIIGNSKFPRMVNCIREPRESLEKCPLCEAGKRLQQKIYIHLIQYTKQEDGSIKEEPKFWQRPISYVTTLKNLMDEYGDLSNRIFKIKRNGAAGSLDTTYTIMFVDPSIYRSDIYIKDSEAFKDVKAVGTVVINKTYDELKKMVEGETDEEVKPTFNTVESKANTTTVETEQITRPRRFF